MQGQRVGAVPAEGTEVVKAHDVVEVLVGDEDGVDPREVLPECLLAQVGTAVDEDHLLRGVEDNRAARPGIVRVVRRADLAVAADDRDPDRSAGAEEGEGRGHGEADY